jgi:hypothetical protein
MDTAKRTTSARTKTYDGFISYSHAADGLLAPRLQSALQRSPSRGGNVGR